MPNLFILVKVIMKEHNLLFINCAISISLVLLFTVSFSHTPCFYDEREVSLQGFVLFVIL